MQCEALYQYVFNPFLTGAVALLGLGFTLVALLFLVRRGISLVSKIAIAIVLLYAGAVTIVYSIREQVDYLNNAAVVRVIEGRFTSYQTDLLRPALWPGFGRLCLDMECFDFETGFPGVGFRGRLNQVAETRLSHLVEPASLLRLALTVDQRIVRIEQCAAQEPASQ